MIALDDWASSSMALWAPPTRCRARSLAATPDLEALNMINDFQRRNCPRGCASEGTVEVTRVAVKSWVTMCELLGLSGVSDKSVHL